MPNTVGAPNVHAYHTSPFSDEKHYKGKRPDLKCRHCHNIGHSITRCWSLDPEMKP